MKEKIKIKMNLTLILFVVITLMQLVVIIHFGSTKSGLFTDEVYSYGLANSHYVPFLNPGSALDYGDHSGWVKSDYFTSYIEVNKNDRFSYGSVYYNQANDVHPPFYYYLLHTVCSFFPDSYSKWYGIGLNIPIFILCNIVLYYLSKYILKDEKLALLPCLLWGFSAAGISNILYIRMYLLLTFFMLILALWHIQLIKAEKIRVKHIIQLLLIVSLGGITHYYFYMFAFFVAVGYGIYFLFSKSFKKLFLYCVTMLGGVMLAVLMFPACLEHVFSGYRGTETRSNLFNSNLDQFKGFGDIINQSFFGGLIIPFLLVCLVICIIFIIVKLMFAFKNVNGEKKRIRDIFIVQKSDETENQINERLVNGFVVLFACLMFTLISVKVSPFIINRYLYPAYPFYAIYFLFVLVGVAKLIIKNKNIVFYTSAIILLTMAILSINRSNIEFQYLDAPHFVEMAQKNSDKDCVYIYDNLQWYDTYINLFCLSKYDEVYFLYKEDIDTISDVLEKRDTKDNGLVIYLPESMDEGEKENLLTKAIEKSQYKACNYLFNYYSSVFSLE